MGNLSKSRAGVEYTDKQKMSAVVSVTPLYPFFIALSELDDILSFLHEGEVVIASSPTAVLLSFVVGHTS